MMNEATMNLAEYDYIVINTSAGKVVDNVISI